MISEPVSKLLVAQVTHELGAHQLYLGIALYFERQSLNGWAKAFRDQAVEEAGHATRITSFLIDNGIPFDLPAVRRAPTAYGSATEAVQAALANEIRVTDLFNALAVAATKAGDHRGLQFLQWFLDEQVEEERKIRGLLDLLASGVNLFQAESLLEKLT